MGEDMVVTSGAEKESRFAHLLKPIRDLAENWNIDIAAELVEYLEALSDISIAFEDGETNLNFAEAALLIQGSAMVYSKKVEFLYSLVYNTLDLLCDDGSGPKGKKKSKRRQMANDNDLWKNEREQFLLLDDVVAVSKTSLDLRPKTSEELARHKLSTLKEPFPHAFLAGRSDVTNAALKLVCGNIHSSGAVMLEESDRFRLGDAAEAQDNVNTDMYDKSSVHSDDFDDAGDMYDNDFGPADDQSLPSPPPTVANEASARPTRGQEELSDGEEDGEEVEWERLDPHEKLGDVKPLKKGKTWVVPKNLRSGATAEDVQEEEDSVVPFISLTEPMVSFPRAVLLYPEFKYFHEYQRACERRIRLQRVREAMQAQRGVRVEQTATVEDYGEEEEDNEEFYYDGGGDVPSDDDDDDGDLGPVHLDVDTMAVEEQPSRYVDLVRAHVDSYLKSAERWAKESNLHARVREWKQKLEPFLDEQDRRPLFDIHEYGDTILHGLDSIRENKDDEPQTHSFVEVLGTSTKDDDERMSPEVQRYEICRLFLASLQLANNGNVELSHESNDSDLKIRLVDTVLANKKLEGYLAPSVIEQENKAKGNVQVTKEPKKTLKKQVNKAPVQKKSKKSKAKSTKRQAATPQRRSTRKRKSRVP